MKEKRGWHKGSVIDLTEDLLNQCTEQFRPESGKKIIKSDSKGRFQK